MITLGCEYKRAVGLVADCGRNPNVVGMLAARHVIGSIVGHAVGRRQGSSADRRAVDSIVGLVERRNVVGIQAVRLVVDSIVGGVEKLVVAGVVVLGSPFVGN